MKLGIAWKFDLKWFVNKKQKTKNSIFHPKKNKSPR